MSGETTLCSTYFFRISRLPVRFNLVYYLGGLWVKLDDDEEELLKHAPDFAPETS